MKRNFDQKRRSLIKSASLMAAGIALPSLSQSTTKKKQKTEWKMITAWPADGAGHSECAKFLAENIEEATDGVISVKIHSAGELCSFDKNIQFVIDGHAQICHGIGYLWKDLGPIHYFFSGIPFGMNAIESTSWLEHGGGQMLWDEYYAKYNLKPFLVGNCGAQFAGWYNKEITKITDLKGLRIRMSGLPGKVFSDLGAQLQILNDSDVLKALKESKVDGMEWANPYVDYKKGLHLHAKYYYGPAWHEPGTSMEAVVNKKAYQLLTPSLQHQLHLACQSAHIKSTSYFFHQNSIYFEKIKTESKAQFKTFSDEILTVLKNEISKSLQEMGKFDSLEAKIKNSYLQHLRRYSNWNSALEAGVLDLSRL